MYYFILKISKQNKFYIIIKINKRNSKKQIIVVNGTVYYFFSYLCAALQCVGVIFCGYYLFKIRLITGTTEILIYIFVQVYAGIYNILWFYVAVDW